MGNHSISKYAGEYARVFLTEDGGYTFEEEIRITVRESRYHNKDGYVFKSEDRGKTWEYAGNSYDGLKTLDLFCIILCMYCAL